MVDFYPELLDSELISFNMYSFGENMFGSDDPYSTVHPLQHFILPPPDFFHFEDGLYDALQNDNLHHFGFDHGISAGSSTELQPGVSPWYVPWTPPTEQMWYCCACFADEHERANLSRHSRMHNMDCPVRYPGGHEDLAILGSLRRKCTQQKRSKEIDGLNIGYSHKREGSCPDGANYQPPTTSFE